MSAKITVASRAKANEPAGFTRQDFEAVEPDQPGFSWTRRAFVILLGFGGILFSFFARPDAAQASDPTDAAKPDGSKPDAQKGGLADGASAKKVAFDPTKDAVSPGDKDFDAAAEQIVQDKLAEDKPVKTHPSEELGIVYTTFDPTIFDPDLGAYLSGEVAGSPRMLDFTPASSTGGAVPAGMGQPGGRGGAGPVNRDDTPGDADGSGGIYDIAELFAEMGEIFEPLPDTTVAQISTFTVGDLVREVPLDHLFAETDRVDSPAAAPFVATVTALREIASRSELIPADGPDHMSGAGTHASGDETGIPQSDPFSGSLDFA